MLLTTLYDIFVSSQGITTDSRKVKEGQLYFALKGDNFNGNLFAEAALDKGAAYVIVDEKEVVKNEKYILVENVLNTLQDLARHHRKQFNIPIVAITRSNGKTTTKE